ncbi:phage tail sheath C-terminal domain-containing protein [Streptomyces sp. BE20]|uniref:phage tail sheath family protein n=1 Tax=Streptomyces sp. BE20 TaxID=3002525 RepID=UPI002E7A6FE6|nr:phage tail sheath C-terminal domain-containing protein [Streptomyces sp. BE20]MEE1820792.1 phage tail sheath C-terminal domain-containing protein [Streptomyces sp. BE20]
MADSVSFPGVYVEETFSFGLSVQSGNTAVTAFIGDFPGVPAGGTRVYSWPDFTELAGADGNGDVLKALGPVLKSYFLNGGGYCYLVSTAGSSLAEALEALDALRDVTILVAPGLWDQGAQAAGEWARALTGWAARNQAMAVLHTDRDHTADQAGTAVDAWNLDETARGYAAVYFPWLSQSGDDGPIVPSGAVAGAWSAVDGERGVWKAPANIVVRGIVGPLHQATDADQGAHRNLNFIRTFTGMGTLIWGARTLSETEQWRYIPIRRLANTVERDIHQALRPVVFEPNTQPTWERVRAAVDTYLHGLWRQGAVQGNTAQEAYFVQVGKGVTMTEADVAAGRLIVKVGIAALRPAEFSVLQFTQELGRA